MNCGEMRVMPQSAAWQGTDQCKKTTGQTFNESSIVTLQAQTQPATQNKEQGNRHQDGAIGDRGTYMDPRT